MDMETEKIIKEVQKIADTINMPIRSISQERYKIAVQIQRNKILKEELSAIYSILDDIRYNRIN